MTRKCTALKRKGPIANALDFFKGLFEAPEPCDREAVYLGFDGAPLCKTCGEERKRDHEAGETMLALYQQEKLGKILPFPLRPIDGAS